MNADNIKNMTFEEMCIKKQDTINPLNLTWSEVAEIFGMTSGEAARCKWKKMKHNKISDIQENQKKTIEKEVPPLSKTEVFNSNKQLDLEKERIKLSDQKRELRNMIRDLSRFEHLTECLSDAVDKLSREKILEPFNVSPIVSIDDKEAVLMLSDWHSELEVDNFLNTFNKDVFVKRINYLTAKTIGYCNFNNVTTLHVINLGDLVNGIIHVNARVSAGEDVITQLMYVTEILAEMLSCFARYFNVKYYNVIDNHSRLSSNKDEAIDAENFMRIIPWYLNTRLRDFNNIKIYNDSLDDEIAIFDVCGYTCIGVHGSNDRINSIAGNLSLMTKVLPDYILTSHFHHNAEDETHSVEIIINPSLSGTDNYAKGKRKTSKPAQKLLIFNKEVGREATYSIRLDI